MLDQYYICGYKIWGKSKKLQVKSQATGGKSKLMKKKTPSSSRKSFGTSQVTGVKSKIIWSKSKLTL